MIKNIDSNEISVVIQGPIYGKPSDVYKNQLTRQACDSIRKLLPEAEIIISTWKESDTTNISCDKVLLNDDPGCVEMLVNGYPTTYNTNRMIRSSKNGVLDVDRKYCLKMRSDIILENTNFINYFYKYKNSNLGKILNERIVTLSAVNQKRANLIFQINDWFEFGLSSDLKKRWFIDEQIFKVNKIDGKIHRDQNLSSEEYVWLAFASKYDFYSDLKNYGSTLRITDNFRKLYEIFIAENLVLFNTKELGIKCLKHPKRFYGRIDFMKMIYYTHNEWKFFYNKHCNGDQDIKFRIDEKIELLIFYIVKFLQKINIKFYSKFKEFYKIKFMN